MNLNEEFWDNRYQTNEIGWDLGTVSTPLKTYFDQLENKDLKILIPGESCVMSVSNCSY